ncbi:MAG: hypothetical protein DME19_02960 [Verrucomicrobia bacterium]|nr:MAG: hypothetical protein DME19_02960 [Verrucomicrobiota bacterium]
MADAVRLALAGDAGQRVLVAWHFSWEPALQVAGRSWIPPVLAQTVSPDSRPSPQASLLERWSRDMSTARDPTLPVQTLVRLNDTTAMQEGFRRLLRQRDERPVRLRE